MLSLVVSLMREKRSSHSCGQKRQKDALAWGVQITGISTFSPQKTEHLSAGTAPGELAEHPPALI